MTDSRVCPRQPDHEEDVDAPAVESQCLREDRLHLPVGIRRLAVLRLAQRRIVAVGAQLHAPAFHVAIDVAQERGRGQVQELEHDLVAEARALQPLEELVRGVRAGLQHVADEVDRSA